MTFHDEENRDRKVNVINCPKRNLNVNIIYKNLGFPSVMLQSEILAGSSPAGEALQQLID